jgi:hypothetical protein
VGIKVKYLNFFEESLKAAGILSNPTSGRPEGMFAGYKMAELGNQHMKHHADPELEIIDPKKHATGKEFFTWLGFDHTSFDINGQDGTLQIDLGEPIPSEYKAKFDIVTNFGTTEHVNRQSQCFKNIHKMLKVGGIVVHIVPSADGPLKKHGVHQYTLEFFTDICRLFPYETIIPAAERDSIPGCISACLRKI